MSSETVSTPKLFRPMRTFHLTHCQKLITFNAAHNNMFYSQILQKHKENLQTKQN